MRLIDADELKKNFQDELCKGIACAECSMQAEGFCRVERWIDIAPTIEAEPIVRCRDCKWWDKDNGFDDKGYCDLLDSYWRPDEYCSDGERRDDGTASE